MHSKRQQISPESHSNAAKFPSYDLCHLLFFCKIHHLETSLNASQNLNQEIELVNHIRYHEPYSKSDFTQTLTASFWDANWCCLIFKDSWILKKTDLVHFLCGIQKICTKKSHLQFQWIFLRLQTPWFLRFYSMYRADSSKFEKLLLCVNFKTSNKLVVKLIFFE